MRKINEPFIINQIIDYLENKADGNWHHEKTRKANLHEHGPDIIFIGGKNNSERFIVECKGKSYAKSAKSINKEGWLTALDQPEYHIVPSSIIAKTIRKDHEKWLATPGKNGQKHNDNPIRKFNDPNDKYLNKWDYLTTKNKANSVKHQV